jgi:hypothetical protein
VSGRAFSLSGSTYTYVYVYVHTYTHTYTFAEKGCTSSPMLMARKLQPRLRQCSRARGRQQRTSSSSTAAVRLNGTFMMSLPARAADTPSTSEMPRCSAPPNRAVNTLYTFAHAHTHIASARCRHTMSTRHGTVQGGRREGFPQRASAQRHTRPMQRYLTYREPVAAALFAACRSNAELFPGEPAFAANLAVPGVAGKLLPPGSSCGV